MKNYQFLVTKQKAFFRTGISKDIGYRLEALKKMRDIIKKKELLLIQALKADLNKSEFESYSTEIGIVLEELRFTMKHLCKWIKPQKVKTPITHFGSTGHVYPEPYGTALIIAPWNYPFQLAISPLIGAIAAGNCAILKPSELTPKISEVIEELISEIFPPEYISVVMGGVETSQALLDEKFDYIFFTGSVPVGKIVMNSASRNLIPVTLELGGKSPCIVHEDADIKLAAKRIAWGKFMNAGQTCVAPDFLYLHQNSRDKFLKHIREAIKELYGEHILNNPNYTRIVSEKHFNRLKSFLDNGEIIVGGKINKDRLSIEPTIMTNISWESPIMQEEIFGPILPILEYHNLSEVIEEICHHPKPLALYLFSENKITQQEVLRGIPFGGGCINDTIYHMVSPYLPFGGVGTSGIGAYHGKKSFDTFSHKKSILKQTTLFDIPLRYPNVKNGLRIIKYLLR